MHLNTMEKCSWRSKDYSYQCDQYFDPQTTGTDYCPRHYKRIKPSLTFHTPPIVLVLRMLCTIIATIGLTLLAAGIIYRLTHQ